METFPSNTPLNDLGQGFYSPYPSATPVQGGLYPGGYNQRLVDHNNDGLYIAQHVIVPRSQNGDPDPHLLDPDSKVVLISIGMCNTTIEFGSGYHNETQYTFKVRATNDNAKRGRLVVVDCAKAGKDAEKWANAGPPDPNDPNNPWTYLDSQLTQAGVSRKQVQVVWLKEAAIEPARDGVWPSHAKVLRDNLELILDHLVSADPDYGFGNVEMVFLSPRTRAWTLDEDGYRHNPEPYAYETGFADKWVIQDQLQTPRGNGSRLAMAKLGSIPVD